MANNPYTRELANCSPADLEWLEFWQENGFEPEGMQAALGRGLAQQSFTAYYLQPQQQEGAAARQPQDEDFAELAELYECGNFGADPPLEPSDQQGATTSTRALPVLKRNDRKAQEAHESLSGSIKARLRWTPELHQRFAQAISQLGGPEKATPKRILKLMGVEGLTIYHIKSHLQKFRLNMLLPSGEQQPTRSNNSTQQEKSASSEGKPSKAPEAVANSARQAQSRPSQSSSQPASTALAASSAPAAPPIPPALPSPTSATRSYLEEALRLQMEMQKRLHDQLEMQRQLQTSLEAHGQYIASLLQQQGLSHVMQPPQYSGGTAPAATSSVEPPGMGHVMQHQPQYAGGTAASPVLKAGQQGLEAVQQQYNPQYSGGMAAAAARGDGMGRAMQSPPPYGGSPNPKAPLQPQQQQQQYSSSPAVKYPKHDVSQQPLHGALPAPAFPAQDTMAHVVQQYGGIPAVGLDPSVGASTMSASASADANGAGLLAMAVLLTSNLMPTMMQHAQHADPSSFPVAAHNQVPVADLQGMGFCQQLAADSPQLPSFADLPDLPGPSGNDDDLERSPSPSDGHSSKRQRMQRASDDH